MRLLQMKLRLFHDMANEKFRYFLTIYVLIFFKNVQKIVVLCWKSARFGWKGGLGDVSIEPEKAQKILILLFCLKVFSKPLTIQFS